LLSDVNEVIGACFVGEFEAKKVSEILYKALALYGKSYFLPLIIWTPVTILVFLLLRHHLGICSVPAAAPIHSSCSIIDRMVDSFAAYFQFPRSATIPMIQ
jgi:hypothetical protein